MIPVTDPFMAGVKPSGLQRGRGGFLRSADDAPYVTDPSGEVCKTGDRKGEIKRVKYGSPSNRGREIENDAALVKHRQRLSFLGIGMDTALAEQCRDLALMDADSDEFRHAADRIAVEADKLTRSWLAADRGSHGHLICELVDRDVLLTTAILEAGYALGLDYATQLATQAAWEALLAASGLEILAIEASCVDDTWRLAGTLDRIVRTTKPLTFAKPGGELVTIPANTVLILDIKFGKCRKAHPIQIASYAQSVPYDTDTEVRGEWPYRIDQTHALIAHGDFGDDTRPVTIELVWVDLVAGREHGGQCVVDAKAWAARDDVFSVAMLPTAGGAWADADVLTAQIVEGDGAPAWSPAPSTLSPDTQIVEGEGDAATSVLAEQLHLASVPSPSTCSPESSPAAGEVRAISPSAPSPAQLAQLVTINNLAERVALGTKMFGKRYRLDIEPLVVAQIVEGEEPIATQAAAAAPSTLSPDPERLTLVDARAALCPNPDEGADWSSDEFAPLWEQLRGLFDDLDLIARGKRSDLVTAAMHRGVPFHAQGGRTERRFWINKAVIALALAGEGDDILRELLAHIIGDVALFAGVEPGHALGSLGAVEAQSFAHHVDAHLSPPPAA